MNQVDRMSHQISHHHIQEQALLRRIQESPNDAEAHNQLGNLYQNQLQRYKDAERAYLAAIKANPSYPNPYNGLGNLYQSHLGRLEEAEAMYLAVTKFAPDYAAVYNGLGTLYAEHLDRFEEAAQAYKTCHQLKPQNGFAASNLALLALRSQRFEEAWDYLKRAQAAQPQEALFWCVEGLLYCAQGQVERGLARIVGAAHAFRDVPFRQIDLVEILERYVSFCGEAQARLSLCIHEYRMTFGLATS